MAQLEQFSLPITAFHNLFRHSIFPSFDSTGRNLGDTIRGLLYPSEVGHAAEAQTRTLQRVRKHAGAIFGPIFRSPNPHHGVRNATGTSGLNRVNDFEKRKPVEVSIPAADPSDSMLAHEDRGMRVMEQVA